MTAYAIALGPRAEHLRRYFAVNDPPGEAPIGWRPYIWTRDRSRAEMFSTEEKAQDFAREHLTHVDFSVVILPPVDFNAPTGGGSPVLVSVAA